MRRVQSAQRLEAAGNFPGAAQLYRDLIREDPKDAGLHYLLGCALLSSIEPEAALRALREAIRLKPTVPEFFAMQAIALRASHRLDDAIIAADKALGLDPANLAALEAKGDLLYIRGELDAGIGLMMPAYRSGCRNPQYLATLARLLRSAKRIPEAREVLGRAVAAPDAGQQSAMPHMQLGELLEKEGDYDGAWRHYARANALRATVFNPDLHDASVAETIAIWSPERLARLPRAKNRRADQLVFIVGMPRSGTSLAEQIIASHPAAYGGGELNFVAAAARDLLLPTIDHPSVSARLDSLRQPVLDRESQKVQKLMTEPAPRAERFTDKLPQNFLYLGLIELLFPQARVVHCRR
ncbi:MAG TPA: sulfotransferase, partial [Phycisphaerales bacterium]|nr:sulfotransferase [Phycisphaerales bacterium]